MAKEPTAVINITMADGRVVPFPGKRKLQKNSFIDEATGAVTVRLDFRNGETRSYTIPDNLLAKFAAHGAEQKLGDEIAGCEDIADGVLSVDDLIARLNKGEWQARRDAGGMAGTSILLRALMEYNGKPFEVVKAYLMTKTQAQKIALRDNPALAPIIARLTAEAASRKPKVDTDAMLLELEDLE